MRSINSKCALRLVVGPALSSTSSHWLARLLTPPVRGVAQGLDSIHVQCGEAVLRVSFHKNLPSILPTADELAPLLRTLPLNLHIESDTKVSRKWTEVLIALVALACGCRLGR